jgi:hypothetical protein
MKQRNDLYRVAYSSFSYLARLCYSRKDNWIKALIIERTGSIVGGVKVCDFRWVGDSK